MAALARLRAVAAGSAVRDSFCLAEGEIPAARVHELQQQLPALTRGEGVLECAFGRYQRVRGLAPVRPRPGPDPLSRREYLLQVTRGLPGPAGSGRERPGRREPPAVIRARSACLPGLAPPAARPPGVSGDHRGTGLSRGLKPPMPAGRRHGRMLRPGGKGAQPMSALTAWRFSGTEGADEAVLRLKQLDGQDLIDVEDVTVIRWPQYAAAPVAHEHVTDQGGKVSSLVSKIRGATIDSSTVEAVKGDMTPGTSALVLLSSDAVIGPVAEAFQGQGMELIRSSLSVQQEDQMRAAFGSNDGAQPGTPPGDIR